MFDIESTLLSCNSVETLGESYYGGKSGKTLIYPVEISTNPVEFLAELTSKKDYKYFGIIYKQAESGLEIYALKIVDDLFNYLIKQNYFDGNDSIQNCEEKVIFVVDRLKEDSLAINADFYYNELTPEWFDNYYKEKKASYEEPVYDLDLETDPFSI